ncbi:MAG TPA: DUF1648 domain-containing protein [Pseudolysinimonas sp.]|jgi:hypothetical protein|nr:DUF1648 domain-containing protein [Pseudolysinimonas sp.]
MTRLSFRILLVSLLVPVVLTVVAAAVQFAWLPQLPASVAVHWSADGRPDGYGPAWSLPVLTLVAGLGIAVLFTLILAGSVREPGPTATQKILAVAAIFAATDVALATTASLAVQRDAGAGPVPIGAFVGGSVVLGLALAAGAWFVLPRAVSGRATPVEPVAAVEVAPGERVVWVGYARFPTGVLLALIATVVLVTGGVAFAIATSGMWWLALIPFVLLVAVLTTTAWRVRVDAEGLTVRAMLGWPAIRVPAAEVSSAGTTQLVPLGEFGGYGLRSGLDGRLGVITRSGTALEVRRRDGRAVVVTVDDAATAAGLLEAYASARAS